METQAPASENFASSAVKAKYRVTNWPEYDRALVQRGSLTVWFDEEFVRNHWSPDRTGKRGAPLKYSDMAIQVLLTLKATFRLTYRALEGFGRSLMKLMALEFDVPDHTHMARRAKGLTVQIPRKNRTGPSHIVVDSTGLKIYGEGEWKVRQHGASKRRRWIKLHLAVDADQKDVVAVEVTTEEWHDCEVFGGLIEQVEGKIEQIDADGAYDTAECYEVAQAAEATLVVPPRENAVQWEEGHPRTEAVKQIKAIGMEEWKKASGYHERSIAENAMYRIKQLFGDKLASRLFETQVVEAHTRVAAMNIMTYLGMPISVRVGTTFALKSSTLGKLVWKIFMHQRLFETSFGICIGCKVYNALNKEKAQLCPGGVCGVDFAPAPGWTAVQVAAFIAFLGGMVFAGNWVANNDPYTSARANPAESSSPASVSPEEAARCTVPEFAKKMGHEDMWKLHNNCK